MSTRDLYSVRFQPDADFPTWDVVRRKMGGFQTVCYHIDEEHIANAIAAFLNEAHGRLYGLEAETDKT